jgi:hypothetical protein
MTARPVPKRHWRSYGDDKLPTGAEALDEPFAAFPSWFMRITCDRCGKDRMVNEAPRTATYRSVPSSPACAMTAAAAGQGGWNCSLASRAPAAGRCGRSCCAKAEVPGGAATGITAKVCP